MPAKDVKAYVKAQQNDAADAEAKRLNEKEMLAASDPAIYSS